MLTCISLSAWIWRHSRPYLIVGWLWYLVMLVPVIGLVQVGYQSMADRYTYLPLIGPVAALVWLVADLAGPSVNRRFAVSVLGLLAATTWAGIAAWQTTYWRDDLTLWTRTLNCTTDNGVAHVHLGLVYMARGQSEQAIEQFETSIRIYPDYCEAHYDLACVLNSLGRLDAAQQKFPRHLPIAIRPSHIRARNNLGMLLLNRGNVAAAAEQFQKSLDVYPDYAPAQNNMGLALMASGQYAAAAPYYRRAIELDPDFPQPHANLGLALTHTGQAAEAVAEFESFLRVQPDNAQVLGWLAWVLATARDNAVREGRRAVELARRATELSHGADPGILDALAAAYAESGQYPAAIETAQAASNLAAASRQASLAGDIRKRLALYRASQPFHQ